MLAVEAEVARVGYRAGDLPEPLLAGFTADGGLLHRALAVPFLVMKPLLAVCVQRDAGVFRLIALAGEELEPAPDASESTTGRIEACAGSSEC